MSEAKTDRWHWLRHKWTNWTPYIQRYKYLHKDRESASSDLRQQRQCLTCGIIQDSLVADGTSQIIDATPDAAKNN